MRLSTTSMLLPWRAHAFAPSCNRSKGVARKPDKRPVFLFSSLSSKHTIALLTTTSSLFFLAKTMRGNIDVCVFNIFRCSHSGAESARKTKTYGSVRDVSQALFFVIREQRF